MADLEKLRIGDFVLNPSRNLLSGPGGDILLEPKVVDVLTTLAVQPGVVFSRDALIDAVWKAEYGADERLTRAISQLRKAFGDERGAPRYVETVSKRGYRLVATVETLSHTEARSEPAAVASAVIARPNGETPSPMPQTAQTASAVAVGAVPIAPTDTFAPAAPLAWWQSRHVHAIGGAAAALAIAAVTAWFWLHPDTSATSYAEDVIELRPFVVIGGDPAMDTFARRTHATLKRVFASNQQRVVERDDTPSQPPARKESEFILAGTLEKAADAYAVTLYFDDRASGQTLWSQRLTRSVTEEAGLRETVGATAAHMISCALKQRAKSERKPSTQAFMIYLEFCDWNRSVEKWLAAAERLVDIAPDDPYGHGRVALANSLLAVDGSGATQAQIDGYTVAARRAAKRALELDPKNEDASLALSNFGSFVEWWLGLDVLIERQPWFATVGLREVGRLKEAIDLNNLLIARTPLLLGNRTVHAALHLQAGYHEAAERILAELLRLRPDDENGRFYRFIHAAFYGRPSRAQELLKDDSEFLKFDGPYRSCWRAFLEARGEATDHRREAAAVRKACEEFYRTADEPSRDYVVRMLAALGDVDGAYELMRTKSWAWVGTWHMLWYPEMAPVRRDARFMPLIVPSQLPEYWLKSGHWPDFCQGDVLPYDCKAAATQALKGGVAVTGGP